MNHDDFIDLCQYLYGERWQCSLAREIGVNPRTARRWAAGQPVPMGVIEKLRLLAVKKSADGKKYRKGIK